MISIIMPVYNAEKTVSRMADSIISQTFNDWELICIDDGSTDNSGVILDSYAQKDGRIRVIHKSNEGVSAARQDGLDVAKGEYIIHADADDWVELTMLEDMYKIAQEDNSDIIICDFFVDKNKSRLYKIQKPSSYVPLSVLHDLFYNLHGSCCNKFIKRSCIQKYNVRFVPGIDHCEDFLFWVQLLQHEEVKISYLGKAYYHYCVNENSITRSYSRETYYMRKLFQSKLFELLPLKGLEIEKKKVAFDIFTEAFIFDILSDEEIQSGLKEHRECIRNVKSLKWRIGFVLLGFKLNLIAHQLIHY